MNELHIFNSEEFGDIRTVTIDNEPWFVGKDVATALGYKNTADAIGKHIDTDDKLTSQIAIAGQRRDVVVINESGLYALILGSKLESAKRFKRWVTSEVLPAIRHNGGYIMGQENLSDSELMAKAILVAQKTIEHKNQIIEQQKAKIEQGLFEIKESNVQNPDGSVRITRTTKVSGKGQLYFVNKFLGQEVAS